MRRLDYVDNWALLARQTRYQPEGLAAACSVSASQLRRYFKDVSCRTPHDWLNELRAWHAMEMICAGSATKVVAVELHFGDPPHLCRQFKAYHNCTPSECFSIYKARLESAIARQLEKELLLSPWKAAERALVSQVRPLPWERERR